MSDLTALILAIVAFLTLRNLIERRVTAVVSALASALKAAEHDFFGPGNTQASRAMSNARQMLRGAEDKLKARNWAQAEEMAKLGQELLKVAYLKSHS